MKAVLNASALLAYLQDESGRDAIEACLSLGLRLGVPVLTTD
jgi:PIN domain nuclease of toxin-antitoxin system